MKQYLRPLLAVCSTAALAACSSSPRATPPMFCPQVAVLQQTQNLVAFLPGRSDVGAQITTAQITGVAGSCQLEPKKHLIVVSFQAGFSATNGPADNGAPLTLPYFVAIADGNDNIISKTNYTINLAFDGNASTAEATSKPVKIEVSNRREDSDLQVLVGFDLTPQQLSYAESHPVMAP